MNLSHYIQGIRKGNEINRIERQALTDPFLADALDGFDKVNGQHAEKISRLQAQIKGRTRAKKRPFRYWIAAASVIAIASVGTIFYLRYTHHLESDIKQPPAQPAVIPVDTIALREKFIADSIALAIQQQIEADSIAEVQRADSLKEVARKKWWKKKLANDSIAREQKKEEESRQVNKETSKQGDE